MEKGTIICVDDEKIVLTSLKSQLNRFFDDKFEIEIAESAEEALDIIAELKSDKEDIPVIICDQIMPGMKGDEFLIEIHKKFPRTLKILLTGQADATAVGNAVNKAKLYRYIGKPWEESDLQLTVKEAIRSFFQDKELEERNKELELLNKTLEDKVKLRTAEVVKQKEIIEQKNNDITDSINYAKRIQAAVLPRELFFEENFSEYFILHKPKDIVSGDFYFAENINNKIYIAVADCTGHGVPGAFMSMLGTAFLTEIINKKELQTTSEILNLLRIRVKNSLHQTGKDIVQKDGMDIAFCIIDKVEKKLKYSGANNPLYVIRNKEVFQLQPDKQPIAVYINETDFSEKDFDFEENDIFYMFSDGFPDQFGGENRKKFMIKRFRELLIKISELPLVEQKTFLENTLKEWMNNYEQIDDILVMGLKP